METSVLDAASPLRAAEPWRGAGCTLTGIDRFTPAADAQRLLDRRGVELALLLSFDHTGPRFLTPAEAEPLLAGLAGTVALHLCGPAVRRALLGGALDGLLARAARVQVNGAVAAAEAIALRAVLPAATWLVTQYAPALPDLTGLDLPAHALLVDASGGTGRLPRCWQRPPTAKPVGFAGGLDAANLAGQWPRIADVAGPGWWIDAESSLRDLRDRFDARRAHAFVDAFEACLAKAPAGPGRGLA